MINKKVSFAVRWKFEEIWPPWCSEEIIPWVQYNHLACFVTSNILVSMENFKIIKNMTCLFWLTKKYWSTVWVFCLNYSSCVVITHCVQHSNMNYESSMIVHESGLTTVPFIVAVSRRYSSLWGEHWNFILLSCFCLFQFCTLQTTKKKLEKENQELKEQLDANEAQNKGIEYGVF